MKKILYAGLDVHKKNIVMAISRKNGEAEIAGEYLNTESGVKKLLKKLATFTEEYEIHLCYEAGPCGFALKRILDKYGYNCDIIAPSLIPVRSGDRIKTDKKDAKKLAKLFRAGELTTITVPNEENESIRDFVRCRDDIMNDLKRSKQRLNHFLIRHGFHYEKSNWTKMHLAWIKTLEFDNNVLRQTFEQYLNQVEYLSLQLEDLDKEIERIALTDEYRERVNALCAFRGIGILTSMIILSEIIDFNRFSNPRELMAYLGMVPSEYSSGGKIKKGSITKSGNTRIRKALVEAAHHYRHKAIITKTMKDQMERVAPELRIAPTKAMKRLSKRYWYLISKGKQTQVAVVAVARELVGFLWHNMIMIEGKI